MIGHELHFFPDWRRFNPYQDLLFADLGTVGATPVPVRGLLRHLRTSSSATARGVLNVHSTGSVLQGLPDADAAGQRAVRLERELDRFVAAGGRLVWTVHNVLPHDAVHREAEIRLARAMAEHADVIHVLTPRTADAVAPYYRLDPARTVCIPHSSYLGAYPDTVDRQTARRTLGLDEGDVALLTLGRIRPYKGLDRLLELTADLAVEDHRLRLLVAGSPGTDEEAHELADRLAAAPHVVSLTRRLHDDEIQVWMRAADLAVLPYLRVLNSGSFLLAETFGLPVVAPRTGALVEREGDAHVRLFDDADLGPVLAAAVSDLVRDPEGARAARAAAEAAARARPPSEMAAAFARLVGPLWEFTEP